MPYESATVKDAYDPRRFIRNPILPPQLAVPPAYYFHSTAGKVDNGNREPMDSNRDIQHKPPQPCMHNKMAPDIALDMTASPFYLSGTKVEQEMNLLQAKSPFNGIVAAAGGHRKVGNVQFALTRMY